MGHISRVKMKYLLSEYAGSNAASAFLLGFALKMSSCLVL